MTHWISATESEAEPYLSIFIFSILFCSAAVRLLQARPSLSNVGEKMA